MPKLYAEGSTKMNKLQPKKETVDFILNYSKALKVINCLFIVSKSNDFLYK